jgi:TRAP-type C4-dicarboxylate transport system permease small subunit
VSGAAAVALLRRALDLAAALLLVAVLGVATAQVAARYLLGVPMPWGEELTRLLFVWLVLLAAARATHMRIDLLPDALSPRARRGLGLVQAALAVFLLLVLAWHGRALVELTAYDRYTALEVSVQWLYWAVVVGCGLWALMTLLDAIAGPAPADLPPE